MSEPITLTPNECQAIELLRSLKANKGHGTLRIEVRDGMETLFRPEPSVLPIDRQAKPRC